MRRRPGAPVAPPALLGLAHVASCSFLAARLAPSGQFWVALAGGAALARAGERHGLRAAYGASVAAVVQTVALIGPARVSGPLTQALNAPLLGVMSAHGSSRAARIAACLAIRLLHYAVLNVLFVVVIVGGLEAYVATYDRIAGFLRILPTGTAAALGLTVLFALAAAVFYSAVQVLAYERALARWPEETTAGVEEDHPHVERPHVTLPVAVLAITAAAWVALLASPSWPVLAGVTGGLALAVAISGAWRAGRDVWAVGLGLAAVLSVGALIPAIIGAVPLDDAGRRAIRAALLVLTATWARAAAGSAGLREAARRALWRARRVPAAGDAASITAGLESDSRLMPAARALADEMRGVEQKILPIADALTAWVAAEARRYRPPAR